MIKLMLIGPLGKMGREIIKCLIPHPEISLIGSIGRADADYIDTCLSDHIGDLPHALGQVKISSVKEVSTLLKLADVIVDFSSKEFTMSHLSLFAKLGKPFICGNTGFSQAEMGQVRENFLSIPYLYSPNMALGVNLLFEILKEIPDLFYQGLYDIDIFEAHHKHKKDAPSGTALKLAQIIETTLEKHKNRRPIGMLAQRAGGLTGEHHVSFTSEDEQITVSHRSLNRRCYAQGVIEAVKFMNGKAPGAYSMQDVLS